MLKSGAIDMQNHSSSFKNFTRGGQTTLHFIRMFWQVLRYGLLWVMLVVVLVFGWNFYSKTTKYDFYLMNEYFDANLKAFFHGERAIHEVKNKNGSVVRMRAMDFVNHPGTQRYLSKWKWVVNTSLKNATNFGVGFLIVFLAYCIWRGKRQSETNNISGQGLVEPKKLKKLLKKHRKASPDYTLAGVPLIKDSETQHILMMGATGSGKSIAMKELMDQARTKGQRAIVYDIDEAFIPLYYREGKDIILNPLDVRSPVWNIWQECRDHTDYDSVAASLMPEHLSLSDPFWINSARTIFSSLASQLDKKDKRSTQALLQPIFDNDLGTLGALLKDTPAAPLVSEQIEKTAVSIKATLTTYCKALMYLKDDVNQPLFSIRRWIEEDKDDSWLFISSNMEKLESLKPLLSVWLDVCAKTILSLNHMQKRRLWIFLDELPSLHRLPSLMNALSRGRKYGACFVTAMQDVHQLYSVYGRDAAKALNALLSTKVFYRSQEPDTNAWMSSVIGQIETLERKEGISYGAHEMRDGVSIHQERRREAIIKPTDFLELDDLQAYLKLPGSWPVTKLQFEFKKRESISESFIPRDLSYLLLPEEINNKFTKRLDEEEKVKKNKVGKGDETQQSLNNLVNDTESTEKRISIKKKWGVSKKQELIQEN